MEKGGERIVNIRADKQKYTYKDSRANIKQERERRDRQTDRQNKKQRENRKKDT